MKKGIASIPFLLLTTTLAVLCSTDGPVAVVAAVSASVNIQISGGGGGGRRHHQKQQQKIGPVAAVQYWWRGRLAQSGWLMRLEQSVQDANAEIISSARTIGETLQKRRLICLPLLDDTFDPPMGNFAHGHVQYGDKMSLPSCFYQAILINHAPVPFLFAVRRIEGVTGPRVEYKDNVDDDDEDDTTVITHYRPCSKMNVNEAVGGPLDCRAPACYVFLPLWMMRLVRFYVATCQTIVYCAGKPFFARREKHLALSFLILGWKKMMLLPVLLVLSLFCRATALLTCFLPSCSLSLCLLLCFWNNKQQTQTPNSSDCVPTMSSRSNKCSTTIMVAAIRRPPSRVGVWRNCVPTVVNSGWISNTIPKPYWKRNCVIIVV
jgi:hypothetical protein